MGFGMSEVALRRSGQTWTRTSSLQPGQELVPDGLYAHKIRNQTRGLEGKTATAADGSGPVTGAANRNSLRVP